MFALVVGLISMVVGSGSSTGPWLAAGGAAVCAASALSLKVWKKRENNTPYTMMSAGKSCFDEEDDQKGSAKMKRAFVLDSVLPSC